MIFKAFFRLFLLIFIPLALLVLPSFMNPVNIIGTWLVKDKVVDTYKGAFILLEEDLVKVPESDWSQHFEKWNKHFAYGIHLKPLSEFEYNSSRYKKILNNEYILVNSENDADYLLKRVGDSDWVIKYTLDETEDQEVVRGSQGMFALLNQRLQSVEQKEWPQLLQKMQVQFGFPLVLLSYDELFLSQEKVAQLKNRGTAWEFNDEELTVVYKRIPFSDYVLRAGPIPIPGANFTLIALIFGLIMASLSIGILIFVLLLWKDLKKLNDAADSFGDGHLSRRADVASRSMVANLSHSFNTMADRIENAIEEHRELTNAIAHDLRTPLSRLSFSFEMMSEEGVTEQDKQRYAENISSSIDALDHLIQQILVLSRYSRAVDVNHFERFCLADLIQDELDQCEVTHPFINFYCDIDAELESKEIFIDPRAMRRLLNNLLSNAMRYAGNQIKASLRKQGVEYELVVEDDGPGIPEEARESLFRAFVQLDNQQREISREHGLGLAIVQQIAIWHKGCATIGDSTLGGAKIAIQWPIKD